MWYAAQLQWCLLLKALLYHACVRGCAQALKNADGTPCLPAYRLLATMRQGAGRQPDAVKLIDKALSYKKDVSYWLLAGHCCPTPILIVVKLDQAGCLGTFYSGASRKAFCINIDFKTQTRMLGRCVPVTFL
jgi:hypothetical protein